VKLLLKIALSLLGLAVAAIVVVFIFLDTIVGKGIEAGCTKALGVETSVGLVRVGLLTGNFSIRRLRIANPPGFETDHFFSLDHLHFEVPPESLREETIVVRLLELDGVGVSLETVGKKTNYDVILDNLDRFSKTGSADPNAKESAGEGEEGGKGLVIGETVIRDIDARIDLGTVKGASDRVAVEIPEIRLRPNRKTGAAEVSVAEVTQVIVTAVLVGVAKKAPAELAKGLLAGAGGLAGISMEIPGALSTGASSAGGVTVKLGEGVVDAVKGIGGLFGGGDEEK
jgi:hypothetical protein